jgi:hypothetical protein
MTYSTKRKYLFNNLPNELKTKIYKYDNTYKQLFNLVLQELFNYFKQQQIKNILYPHSFILLLL